MRGFGSGSELWRVEIVLRFPHHSGDDCQRELLDAVRAAAQPIDCDDVLRVQDIEQAWSYDIQPQPPDQGIGVACWVLADTIGAATDIAWRVVERAAESTTTGAALWDLRVLPRDSILSPAIRGTRFAR